MEVTVFFFSSRRRHTRLQGDWSSDVCSSDLHCRKIDLHAIEDVRTTSVQQDTHRCIERRLRSALRSEEHTSELQSPCNLVCRLLLEKKKKTALHRYLHITCRHRYTIY